MTSYIEFEKAGIFFREAGLNQLIDYQRNSQFDRFEPWQNVTVESVTKTDDLYNILHLGKRIKTNKILLNDNELQLLSNTEFIKIDNNFITPCRWRLTHFQNIFSVSDFVCNGSSEVYIGDDSFLFSNFLSCLPPNGRGLDIGFGSGISSVALAQSCQHVAGIDILQSCKEAGYVTAALNGLSQRLTFETEDISKYTTNQKFDVVCGNPPGVPIPKGLNYSVVGNGGEDGLDLVKGFLNFAIENTNSNGTIAMRFQSVGNETGVLAHEHIINVARENDWDVQFHVDIEVPIEVRSALSTKNALLLNPKMTEAKLLSNFDTHMREIKATKYTSTLMLVKLQGSGRCSVNNLVRTNGVDAEFQRSFAHCEDFIEQGQANLASLIYNAPGILWRIHNVSDAYQIVQNYKNLIKIINVSSTTREVYHSYLREHMIEDRVQSRGLIILFQLFVLSLKNIGFLNIIK